MNARDEFPLSVKRVLASRAGHRCSNPRHGAPTSAPHDDEGKSVNIGVAAHISAAAEGGPRFNPTLSQEGRADIANAIWLCQNCAKLIDSDPKHYTVALLRRWKRGAEARALRALGRARRPTTRREVQAAREAVEKRIVSAAGTLEGLQREQIQRLQELGERIEALAAMPPAARRRSVSASAFKRF